MTLSKSRIHEGDIAMRIMGQSAVIASLILLGLVMNGSQVNAGQGVDATGAEIDRLTAQAQELVDEANRLLAKAKEIGDQVDALKREKKQLLDQAQDADVNNNQAEAKQARQAAQEKDDEIAQRGNTLVNVTQKQKKAQGRLDEVQRKITALKRCLQITSCSQAVEATGNPDCVFDGRCR